MTVSSVEHKQRFLSQTAAVCQSYNGSQWDSRLWVKKTYTYKTKLNPAARDDTLRSKDTKRTSVQETEQYLYRFLPLIRRMVQLSWVRSQQLARDGINNEWHTRNRSLPRMRLLCQSMLTRNTPDVVNALRTAVHYGRFGFVCVCCFDSQSRESHWLTLYDWQTAAVWVKKSLCSTEETKSPTSWMPWG